MSADRPAARGQFSFTKVVVDDLDRCAAFYRAVFGLSELARVDDEIAGEPISEIMFSPTSDGAATFVLLTYRDRSAAAVGEVICGFITPDLEALVARATDAGGRVVDDMRVMPALGVKVAFVADVEGHVLEVVELLA